MINYSLPIIFEPTQETRQTLDVATEDCTDLLYAVSERLRATADDDFASTFRGYLLKQAQPTHTSILECVAALEQIRKTWAYEMIQRKSLELELHALRAALRQNGFQPQHTGR